MIWTIILIILGAGAVGGVINALMTDNGFVLPKYEDASGNKILRPGVIGNVLIGAIAAVISWGLYGPFASYLILSSKPSEADPSLSLASLVGGVLIGIAGAKWLSNEVDKKLLKATAVAAAAGTPSTDAAVRIMAASPAKALAIAQSLNR
jgi:uncharacterized membrane protein